jgi:hypothetical protein
MTLFLDCRLAAVGGELSPVVSLYGFTRPNTYLTVPRDQMLAAVRGRNVLIGTHGFNVNRADGLDSLDAWGGLLQLTPQDVFIGLLWPGDSSWAHGLDYGVEPKVADHAGVLLGPFLDVLLADAASVSFASHSLGARVILQTAAQMKMSPRRMILMAGAIDDDCLSKEFEAVTEKTGAVSVLASKKDPVLSLAFPLGNLVAGIIDQGHPWWRGALGRSGPTKQIPANVVQPFEIPSQWDFVHGSYLQVDPASTAPILVSQDIPPEGTAVPWAHDSGWQETWTAAVVSTRFR